MFGPFGEYSETGITKVCHKLNTKTLPNNNEAWALLTLKESLTKASVNDQVLVQRVKLVVTNRS